MAGEMHDQSNRVQANRLFRISRLKSAKPRCSAKQLAVDVRKGGQRFVEILLAFLRRRVEHLEQPGQVKPKIGAVRLRAVLDIQTERFALENARVFGKEAEEHPHQKPFQFVAFVAAVFQGVVKIVHDADGLQIDRVLVLEVVLLGSPE